MRTIIFGTILFFLIGCAHQEPSIPSKPSIPHNVVNDELTESTNMAQVDVDIVLDTNGIDSIGLKRLLDYHYERSLSSHPLKHHHRPTIISVRIYKTSDHYYSGMGQIMANKYITPREDYPQYDYEQKYIQAESEKPDKRWGLTLKERKRIWTNIILAEDKATDEAEDKYPIMGNDPDFDIDNVDKNTALTKKLMNTYTTEVYQEHGITEAIGDSIGIEGLKYGWPFP